jgi:hypothetical protein
MATRKAVFVSRFEIPTEPVLTGRPKHEISHGFCAHGIRFYSELVGVIPFRTDAKHKFHLRRNVPGLLEQKVGSPFGGMSPEEGGGAEFQFKPVFYRRDLDGNGRAEAVCAVACNGTECSDSQLPHALSPLRPIVRQRFQRKTRKTEELPRRIWCGGTWNQVYMKC